MKKITHATYTLTIEDKQRIIPNDSVYWYRNSVLGQWQRLYGSWNNIRKEPHCFKIIMKYKDYLRMYCEVGKVL